MDKNQYEGIKHDSEGLSRVFDNLVIEVPLEIYINNKPFTATMHSPGNEAELVRGLLFAEDIYRSPAELPIEIIDRDDLEYIRKLNVNIDTSHLRDGYLNGRSLLSVSSCGICGKKELQFPEGEKLKDNFRAPTESIKSMFDTMQLQQHAYSLTGGSHAAALFDKKGELLVIKEDIGRHNAVDKAVGYAINNDILLNVSFLLVSSRVSFEIVAKCFTAGVPILAAVSAPSSLAVDFCKELGITLLGFCRDDRFTIYSHPERIIS